MKKQITKHFMAFFLSLVMIMAMGLTAFADDENNSLTIHNSGKTNHTFELYQIFTGDLSNGTLSNLKWGNGVTKDGQTFFGDASQKAEALGKDDEVGKVKAREFAEDLVAGNGSTSYLQNSTKRTAEPEGDAVFLGLKAGYYLVMDEANSQNGAENGATTSYIMQVVGNVTQSTKLDVPTVVKKVKDTNDSTGATSDWQDSADADIDDQVEYKITGTLPDNYENYTKYSYVFTDTMSQGLTYTASTAETKSFNVTLYANDNDNTGTDITNHFTEEINNYTGDEQEYVEGKVITWTEKDSNGLRDIPGITKSSKIVITYKATLNKYAKIGVAGNPNKVDLTFSNNPNNGHDGEIGKTPEDKNIVFTYKVVVNKVDQDEKPLAGALFTLSKVKLDKEGKVLETETPIKTYELTGDKDKDSTIFTASGLDDGTYVLKETKTPEGYNTIANQYFTISAKHDAESDNPQLKELTGSNLDNSGIEFSPDITAGSLTTDVMNKEGSTLPSTGGRGTTMIYIIGAALVITAGVVLVMRKKMSSDKEA